MTSQLLDKSGDHAQTLDTGESTIEMTLLGLPVQVESDMMP